MYIVALTNGQAVKMSEAAKTKSAPTNVPWAVSIATVEDDEPLVEASQPPSPAEAPSTEAPSTEPPSAEPPAEKANPPEQEAPETAPVQEPAPAPLPAMKEVAAEPQAKQVKASEPDSEVHCDEAVVRALMDLLIMPDGMIQPQERGFAADLLQMVIGHATTKSKALLCERLANMSDAPAALISRFLNDAEIDIAAPLLLRAACVSESELISVIESGERERGRLIAQRKHLTPVVSTALAKTHDDDIELDLVRNKDAQLSQEAVERLSCRAQQNSKLIEPLVLRPEMTAACALHLFWSMPKKQRSYALGRFLVDIQVLRQVLVMSEPGAELIARAVCGSADQPQGNKSEAPDSDLIDLIAALASANFDDVSRLLTVQADVAQETAARIVSDKGGEPLVVACKAVGVARVAFAEVVEKFSAMNGWEGDVEALKILFDTLSFRQARMALTYWDWQSRNIGPYTDFPCGT